MSSEVIGFEKEPKEAFNWHYTDIIYNPPYGHEEMIERLIKGEFIIEGKVSSMQDAETYAEHYAGEPDVERAMAHYTVNDPSYPEPKSWRKDLDLAINGPEVF